MSEADEPILNRNRSAWLTMKTSNRCRRRAVADRLRHHSALMIDADIRGLSYTAVQLEAQAFVRILAAEIYHTKTYVYKKKRESRQQQPTPGVRRRRRQRRLLATYAKKARGFFFFLFLLVFSSPPSIPFADLSKDSVFDSRCVFFLFFSSPFFSSRSSAAQQ